jgi:hypothetical protein
MLALPLMVIIAFAVKCDSRGPVLIREERIAGRGRRFAALRFRITADRHIIEVTRLGELLRYTRADRLPQLIKRHSRGDELYRCRSGSPLLSRLNKAGPPPARICPDLDPMSAE